MNKLNEQEVLIPIFIDENEFADAQATKPRWNLSRVTQEIPASLLTRLRFECIEESVKPKSEEEPLEFAADGDDFI
jgi:hypothetical protein